MNQRSLPFILRGPRWLTKSLSSLRELDLNESVIKELPNSLQLRYAILQDIKRNYLKVKSTKSHDVKLIPTTILSLILSIVGLGSLSIPWVFVQVGIPLGLLFIGISTYLNIITGWWLVLAGYSMSKTLPETKRWDYTEYTYEHVIEATLGDAWKGKYVKNVFMIASFLRNGLSLMGFFTAIMTFIRTLTGDKLLWLWIVGVGLFLSLLIYKKKIDNPWFKILFSSTSTVFLMIIVLMMLTLTLASGNFYTIELRTITFGHNLTFITAMQSLSILFFSSATHYTILPVWSEQLTKAKNSYVPSYHFVTFAQLAAGIYYSIVGILGSFIFGGGISDNFLNDFQANTIKFPQGMQHFITVIVGFYIFKISISYLFTTITLRLTVGEMYLVAVSYLCPEAKTLPLSSSKSITNRDRHPIGRLRLISFGFLLFVIAIYFAYLSLSFIMSLAGSIITITMVLIIPTLLRMKRHNNRKLKFFLGTSIIIGLITLVATFL